MFKGSGRGSGFEKKSTKTTDSKSKKVSLLYVQKVKIWSPYLGTPLKIDVSQASLACKNLNLNSVSPNAFIRLRYPTTFKQAGSWIGALNWDKSWFSMTLEDCLTALTTSTTMGILPSFFSILVAYCRNSSASS